MKKNTSFIFAFLLGASLLAQEKKSVDILPISTPLTIDGILDEPEYLQVKPAKDFVQLQPHNGKPSFQPTEVHFLMVF